MKNSDSVVEVSASGFIILMTSNCSRRLRWFVTVDDSSSTVASFSFWVILFLINIFENKILYKDLANRGLPLLTLKAGAINRNIG